MKIWWKLKIVDQLVFCLLLLKCKILKIDWYGVAASHGFILKKVVENQCKADDEFSSKVLQDQLLKTVNVAEKKMLEERDEGQSIPHTAQMNLLDEMLSKRNHT